MHVGVDVGGTNTDAVIIDGDSVLAWIKTPTTADVSSGIVTALSAVLSDSKVSTDAITGVMIGTTHFTNAFVEGKRLLKVGVLRIGLPAGRDLPPMIDWPARLKEAVNGHCAMVHGGNEFDGREISPLNEKEILQAARDMRAKGLKAIAISSIFSLINPKMEERAEEIIRNELPDARITLSSSIGRIGLIERENAAIMNASLADLSVQVVSSFRQALRTLDIKAPFYVSQNDGTLMSADFVERYPVLTFASGPTNSMRGAAFLSGVKTALVADIGGTTTDIGMLSGGIPRESSVTVDIGGVRTNFRMPDILAIGLGGGSIVREDGDITVGPDSVGFRLTEESLIFGGKTATASDIAVAAGHADFGDASLVASLDSAYVRRASDAIHTKLEEGVDRMKTSAEPVPLILVGGGAVLISQDIAGASQVIRPDYSSVANAIGAAIAHIGGEVDKVVAYEEQGRDAALSGVKAEAVARAASAGADPHTIEITDVEEIPLSYIPGGAVRVRVRAEGALLHA